MKQKYETLKAYAFLSPVLIIFITLCLLPILFSGVLSFTSWSFTTGLKGIKFIGLDNFTEILQDDRFIAAIKNTFIYAVAVVPVSLAISLIIAYMLNDNIFLKKIIRMTFFIPFISSSVALSAVFKFLFRGDGPINMFLMSTFNLNNVPNWFANSSVDKIPIIILLIWTGLGYEMIIYMAALQDVPKSFYESAEIDGANIFQKFINITIPTISPTIFYLFILRTIAIFKIFGPIHIINYRGATLTSNTSMVVKIYNDAFSYHKFGYASAESWILFVIIFIVTIIQFVIRKKWIQN